MPSRLDAAVATALGRRKMFSGGWPDAAEVEALAARPPIFAAPRPIDVTLTEIGTRLRARASLGRFRSPVAHPGLPPRVADAEFLLLEPRRAAPRPVLLLFAASGEEGFAWRTRLVGPLVERGLCAALVLENPFYGRRRAPGQPSPRLPTVRDQLLMNWMTLEEGRSLAAWLARGGRRVAVSGFSMGGFLAALVAAHAEEVEAAVPIAAGRSAASVYTQGDLSRAVDFDALGGEGGRRRLASVLEASTRSPPWAARTRAIVVAARDDGFVLAEEAEALSASWPGAELRWMRGGHVQAYLQGRRVMRRAIAEVLSGLDGARTGLTGSRR